MYSIFSFENSLERINIQVKGKEDSSVGSEIGPIQKKAEEKHARKRTQNLRKLLELLKQQS